MNSSASFEIIGASKVGEPYIFLESLYWFLPKQDPLTFLFESQPEMVL